jgi:outer membrane protein assembly factor BamB
MIGSMVTAARAARCALTAVLLAAFTPLALAGDWPHWRGPDRNGIVRETSHYNGSRWPAGQTIWSASVGLGASSPIVVEGRLYTLGWSANQETVRCLDAKTGRELWKVSYPAPKYGRLATGDEGLYAGPSGTPEFDPATGLLYTLGSDGHLHCWDTAQNGRKVSGGNLHEALAIQRRARIGRSGQRDYGYTTSPLLYGDSLIVEAGAAQGNLIAFDKRTGKPAWTSQAKDQAGHTGGLVPMTVEGVPCLAVLTLKNLLVVRLDKGRQGETVAQFPWETDFANSIASPAAHEDCVLITSEYNHGTIVKLRITLRGATKVWEQPYASKVCTPVIYNGHVYWAWQKLHCLDLESGRFRWSGGDFGDAGSCIVTADGRIIVWGGRGTLALAESADRSPGAYKELGRLDRLFNTDVWPHVALSDGSVFLKDRDGNLKCVALAPQ